MKIAFATQEKALLERMAVPFNYLTDMNNDDIEQLYDIVPDWMLQNTDTDNDNPLSDFNVCEDIITKIANELKRREILT